jgi:hypothetical protein
MIITLASDKRPLVQQPSAAAKCSSHNASCRSQPTAITLIGSAKTFSDRAATSYGLEDRRGEASGPCAGQRSTSASTR